MVTRGAGLDLADPFPCAHRSSFIYTNVDKSEFGRKESKIRELLVCTNNSVAAIYRGMGFKILTHPPSSAGAKWPNRSRRFHPVLATSRDNKLMSESLPPSEMPPMSEPSVSTVERHWADIWRESIWVESSFSVGRTRLYRPRNLYCLRVWNVERGLASFQLAMGANLLCGCGNPVCCEVRRTRDRT